MVLVVVASGDSLVARMVGEVFRCDLCDPCMMLSCAFILVKKKIFWLVFHPCFQGSLGGALHMISSFASLLDRSLMFSCCGFGGCSVWRFVGCSDCW